MPLGDEPLAEPEPIEHREAVGRDVEEEAGVGVGLVGGLEDLDVPPGALQEQRGGRTGDAASDDEGA